MTFFASWQEQTRSGTQMLHLVLLEECYARPGYVEAKHFEHDDANDESDQQ
jgi:hypothetical protein